MPTFSRIWRCTFGEFSCGRDGLRFHHSSFGGCSPSVENLSLIGRDHLNYRCATVPVKVSLFSFALLAPLWLSQSRGCLRHVTECVGRRFVRVLHRPAARSSEVHRRRSGSNCGRSGQEIGRHPRSYSLRCSVWQRQVEVSLFRGKVLGNIHIATHIVDVRSLQ
jgi:hypothetical protein